MRHACLLLFAAVLSTGFAARAQEAHLDESLSLINRPMTLPAGVVAPVLAGDLVNWSGGDGSAFTGESLKLGVDVGVTRAIQLGLLVGFPINPGASFGTLDLNATVALDHHSAVRVDVGYDRLAENGSDFTDSTPTSREFFGVGLAEKIHLAPMLAFVSGSSAGAATVNRLVNLGSNGDAIYFGASAYTNGGADNVMVSAGNNDSGTIVGVNIPVGLMFQPDPRVALTLRTGYGAVIVIPSDGSAAALHFIPIGLDLVLSPSKLIDVGASFGFEGYIGSSGDNGTTLSGSGFFDQRDFSIFARLHLG